MNGTEQHILDFIHRRFPGDCNWTTGNCYWFAVILKERFRVGRIYYDIIDGHFLYEYDGTLYDHKGIQSGEGRKLIEWSKFHAYDSALHDRIIRDCVL